MHDFIIIGFTTLHTTQRATLNQTSNLHAIKQQEILKKIQIFITPLKKTFKR